MLIYATEALQVTGGHHLPLAFHVFQVLFLHQVVPWPSPVRVCFLFFCMPVGLGLAFGLQQCRRSLDACVCTPPHMFSVTRSQKLCVTVTCAMAYNFHNRIFRCSKMYDSICFSGQFCILAPERCVPYRKNMQLPIVLIGITTALFSERKPDESERSAVKW